MWIACLSVDRLRYARNDLMVFIRGCKSIFLRLLTTWSRCFILGLRNLSSASPIAFGEGGLKERVKNVLNLKKSSRIAIVCAVALVVAAGFGLMTNRAQAVDYSDEMNLVEKWQFPDDAASDENMTRYLPFERDHHERVDRKRLAIITALEEHFDRVYINEICFR